MPNYIGREERDARLKRFFSRISDLAAQSEIRGSQTLLSGYDLAPISLMLWKAVASKLDTHQKVELLQTIGLEEKEIGRVLAGTAGLNDKLEVELYEEPTRIQKSSS